MESGVLSGVLATVILYIGIPLFLIPLYVLPIVASAISLAHAVKEPEKRESFIIISAIGLALSILGLGFFGLILAIISMRLDYEKRNCAAYIATYVLAIIGVIGLYVGRLFMVLNTAPDNQTQNDWLSDDANNGYYSQDYNYEGGQDPYNIGW